MASILTVSAVLVLAFGLICHIAWRIFLAAIKQTATLSYVKGWTDAMEMHKQWDTANSKAPNMQILADYLLARIPPKVIKGLVN